MWRNEPESGRAREEAAEIRQGLRQKESLPILAKMKASLNEMALHVLPKSKLGQEVKQFATSIDVADAPKRMTIALRACRMPVCGIGSGEHISSAAYAREAG